VRREGEQLFKTMYESTSDEFIKELKDQKPQIINKLVNDVKVELANRNNETAKPTSKEL
jgi:hypothetical protein